MNVFIATLAFIGLAVIATIFAFIATPLTLNLLDRLARLDVVILKKMPRLEKVLEKVGLYLFGDEILTKFPKQCNESSKYETGKPDCVNEVLHTPYRIFCKFVKLKQRYYRWCAYSKPINHLQNTSKIELKEPILNGFNEKPDNTLDDSFHNTNSSTGEKGESTKNEPNRQACLKPGGIWRVKHI